MCQWIIAHYPLEVGGFAVFELELEFVGNQGDVLRRFHGLFCIAQHGIQFRIGVLRFPARMPGCLECAIQQAHLRPVFTGAFNRRHPGRAQRNASAHHSLANRSSHAAYF